MALTVDFCLAKTGGAGGMSMNYSEAVTYPFKDERWLSKIGLAALFTVLIVTGPAVQGYMLECARHYLRGHHDSLPEWRFGDYWLDGFRLTLVQCIWALPLFILGGLICASLIAAIGGLGGCLQGADSSSMGGSCGSVAVLGTTGMFACASLAFLYLLLLVVVSPVIVCLMVSDLSYGVGFDFKRIYRIITRDFSGCCRLFLASLVFDIIGGIGQALFGIGQLFTWPYSTMGKACIIAQFLQPHMDALGTGNAADAQLKEE